MIDSRITDKESSKCCNWMILLRKLPHQGRFHLLNTKLGYQNIFLTCQPYHSSDIFVRKTLQIIFFLSFSLSLSSWITFVLICCNNTHFRQIHLIVSKKREFCSWKFYEFKIIVFFILFLLNWIIASLMGTDIVGTKVFFGSVITGNLDIWPNDFLSFLWKSPVFSCLWTRKKVDMEQRYNDRIHFLK